MSMGVLSYSTFCAFASSFFSSTPLLAPSPVVSIAVGFSWLDVFLLSGSLFLPELAEWRGLAGTSVTGAAFLRAAAYPPSITFEEEEVDVVVTVEPESESAFVGFFPLLFERSPFTSSTWILFIGSVSSVGKLSSPKEGGACSCGFF